MVINVVDVDKMIRSVCPAMHPNNVVGDDGVNGGLWCSPVANTSNPTSSTLLAIATVALIRSVSVEATPVVGSGVTSPTVKIPNWIPDTTPPSHDSGQIAGVDRRNAASQIGVETFQRLQDKVGATEQAVLAALEPAEQAQFRSLLSWPAED